MIFPKRIKSIKPSDKVLEIGPGGNPYPRSDVFLEKTFESEDEALRQRAFQPELDTNKKVVFYDGGQFPFEDQEFDYVICSHVLEHVPDVEGFLSEMCRVAKAGYLEYPTMYYDYVYNIPEHVNFLLFKKETMFWMKKESSNLQDFQIIQKLFYESLLKNWGIIEPFYETFVQGFEWFSPIATQKVDSISGVTYDNGEIKDFIAPKQKKVIPEFEAVYKNRAAGLKGLLRRVHYKMGKMIG